VFHTIVGHLCGCGWDVERIVARLEQFPDGIGGRYIGEGRLPGEVARSFEKYRARKAIGDCLPRTGGWQESATPDGPHEDEPPDDDEEQDDEDEPPDEEGDEDEPEVAGVKDTQPDPKLPQLFAHGDPDPRPIKSWLVKRLLPEIGHGLISGQWGTYKTFVALDLAGCVMTGQPFLNRAVSRQSGVLFIAAEGAGEVRLRLNAVIRENCGAMLRAPFRWYEVAPTLLQRGAVDTLVAMAKQAEASLQREFGLPLGLIIIDTIAASAGYNEVGAENDNATGQAVMNALNRVAQQMCCCVLGVDHFGKNIEAGTRGGSAKESSAEVVLAVLGKREVGGRVVDTRVALRKVRAAPQGEEFYFTVRSVDDPQPDADGEPVSTLVIEWQSGPPSTGQAKPEADPWQDGRRSDTRQALGLLRRVLMAVLADRGTPQQTEPDSATRQAVDHKILRTEFCAQVAADGTPEQKRDFRKKKFQRALDHAQEKGLVGIREIGAVTYVWLTTPDHEDDDDVL
jgi:AAA domain